MENQCESRFLFCLWGDFLHAVLIVRAWLGVNTDELHNSSEEYQYIMIGQPCQIAKRQRSVIAVRGLFIHTLDPQKVHQLQFGLDLSSGLKLRNQVLPVPQYFLGRQKCPQMRTFWVQRLLTTGFLTTPSGFVQSPGRIADFTIGSIERVAACRSAKRRGRHAWRQLRSCEGPKARRACPACAA